MPEPLPQAFLYAAFNPVLGQKSDTQGCPCSGLPLCSGTDLVPLCLSSQSLEHLAESVDRAFRASPVPFPHCQGGLVRSTHIAGEGLSHWALEEEGSSPLTTCILLSIESNP